MIITISKYLLLTFLNKLTLLLISHLSFLHLSLLFCYQTRKEKYFNNFGIMMMKNYKKHIKGKIQQIITTKLTLEGQEKVKVIKEDLLGSIMFSPRFSVLVLLLL